MVKATAKPKRQPKLRTVFIKARALLADRKQWGRGRLVDTKGRCCLLGACLVAAGADKAVLVKHGLVAQDNSERYTNPLKACMNALFPNRDTRSVTSFNDRRGTTHADILKVLDCAIKDA